MHVGQPSHFYDSHEEANTPLAFHASNVVGNAVIRASENVVLVILIGMIGTHLTSQKHTHTVALLCIVDRGIAVDIFVLTLLPTP